MPPYRTMLTSAWVAPSMKPLRIPTRLPSIKLCWYLGATKRSTDDLTTCRYRSPSFFCPPKAVTVRIAPNTSWAMALAVL